MAKVRLNEALTEFKCTYTLATGDDRTPNLEAITLGQKLAACHIKNDELAEANNILYFLPAMRNTPLAAFCERCLP